MKWREQKDSVAGEDMFSVRSQPGTLTRTLSFALLILCGALQAAPPAIKPILPRAAIPGIPHHAASTAVDAAAGVVLASVTGARLLAVSWGSAPPLEWAPGRWAARAGPAQPPSPSTRSGGHDWARLPTTSAPT